ncbi:CerR family C-terminal domain-containing protein [Albidovulum sp.]|uniref:CerR family C-terminal domain-containing protein n=1 Tax=Albidovulum sp. TaxID=1872424 RepID=UPI0039B87EA8
MTDLPKAPEGTAADLIAAGLRLFGRKGFAATSIREIAAEAGANVAAIAYHFGNKEGLRRACGSEVARRIGGAFAAVPADLPGSPDAALARMETALRAVAGFVLTAPEAEPVLAFMLREVAEEGPVLDAVYTALMEPVHRRLSALWAAATGQQAEAERTRLMVFTLVGQLLYFRIGKPIVIRRMGWASLGPAEAAAIADVLAGNLRCLIERERRT